MSSTNRGRKKNPHGQYFTPAWCVESLLSEFKPSGENWLEPGAGNGAIIKAVNDKRIHWDAVEIDDKFRSDLQATGSCVHIADYLTWVPHLNSYDVVLGNPDFEIAWEFIQRALTMSDVVVFLLRLNFYGSIDRHAFMRYAKPDVYELCPRPQFIGTTGQDSIEYGWFHFGAGTTGKIKVLPLGPSEKKPRQDFYMFKGAEILEDLG